MEPIQNKLGYTFRNGSLLKNALTHSSYANENRGKSCESNERLEFLGDSVLGLVVADMLYARYPDMPEGRMTRLRAQLVCEESLHRIALELGLGEYLRLGKGEERTGGRHRASVLADAVEALIAAMYIDGGIDVVTSFITARLLSDLGDEAETSRDTDSKTRLQELVQRKSGQELAYELLAESGPDHDKHFRFCVLLNGERVGEGEGRTKKEAEQAAAAAALEKLVQSTARG